MIREEKEITNKKKDKYAKNAQRQIKLGA